MKTAISIPDNVFSKVEFFARKRKITRSALFTIAVDEYIQQNQQGDITKELNEVYPIEESSLDPVLHELQRLSLPKENWS